MVGGRAVRSGELSDIDLTYLRGCDKVGICFEAISGGGQIASYVMHNAGTRRDNGRSPRRLDAGPFTCTNFTFYFYTIKLSLLYTECTLKLTN